jgi:cysteinyl-tRNA synthetase
MIIAMKREGKSPWDIARFYEEAFFKDCAELNIRRPDETPRATEHIKEMIEMVQRLEKNGYTYLADGNVYFDTAKYPRYDQLWGGKRVASVDYARVEADKNKRNPADFVLWFGNSKFKDQAMKWESPWGVGFPGWHIECSAMSIKYLGNHFDIHTGGTDHITGHHSNEIAQAEGSMCACGKPFEADKHWVNYWLHNEFLLDQTGKMSKSKGDFLTLELLKREGIHPLAYRLFLLQGHYRGQLSLNWENLKAAQTAYDYIREKMQEWEAIPVVEKLNSDAEQLLVELNQALADDLNTPMALAHFWNALRGDINGLQISEAERKTLILNFDSVLSLGLSSVSKGSLSAEEQILFDARATARKEKDFKKSDELRDALAKSGVVVKDTPKGQEWTRK